MTAEDTYQAFMLDHAAGTLPDNLHLAGDVHRLMSSEGEKAAELWEAVRYVLLGDESAPPPYEKRGRQDRSLARALKIIQTDFDTVKWRRGLSGAHYAKCANHGGQLMHLDPGQKVYAHGHSALEATVILEGGLEDGIGVYRRGDILLAEPGLRHRPATHGNQACTCFVARAPKSFWRFT